MTTTTSTEDSRRILELLAQGKITVDEADQLLRALRNAASSDAPPDADPASADEPRRETPKWVRITIDKAGRDGRPPKQVTIRVPIAVVRGGARLGAMFPKVAGERVTQKLREQGIDIAAIDFSQIESVLGDLGETTIDVDEGPHKGKAQVRITCE